MELVRPTANQGTSVDVQRIVDVAAAVEEQIANLQALCRVVGTWGEMRGELPAVATEDMGRFLRLMGSQLDAIRAGVEDMAGEASSGLPPAQATHPEC